MKTEDAIYTTHDLAVGYRNGKTAVTLLHGLNLSLEKGKLVALLGQNGAGKSTLLRALTCDERPLSGTIEVNGWNLADMSQKDRSRLTRASWVALTMRITKSSGRRWKMRASSAKLASTCRH